jgi:DNA-damage-inducible protein J
MVQRRYGSPSLTLPKSIVRQWIEMICKRVKEKTAWKDSEFAQSQNTARHDSRFRAKVREALDDLRPVVPHKNVKPHFAKRRSAALRKTKSNGS